MNKGEIKAKQDPVTGLSLPHQKPLKTDVDRPPAETVNQEVPAFYKLINLGLVLLSEDANYY